MILQISPTTLFSQHNVYYQGKQSSSFIEQNSQGVCLDAYLWKGSGREENSTWRVKDKYYSFLWPDFKDSRKTAAVSLFTE